MSTKPQTEPEDLPVIRWRPSHVPGVHYRVDLRTGRVLGVAAPSRDGRTIRGPDIAGCTQVRTLLAEDGHLLVECPEFNETIAQVLWTWVRVDYAGRFRVVGATHEGLVVERDASSLEQAEARARRLRQAAKVERARRRLGVGASFEVKTRVRRMIRADRCDLRKFIAQRALTSRLTAAGAC